jgi:hypothetical protein
LNDYISHLTKHLDCLKIITQCTCCNFLLFYSFLLGVEKFEYIAKGPVRVNSTSISNVLQRLSIVSPSQNLIASKNLRNCPNI